MRPEVQVLLGPRVVLARLLSGVWIMKKLLAIVVAGAGVLAVIKRKKGQASSDVWKQATR
jgi:hypothetical protein